MTEFFVYHHVRPDTNEVFYVGKGSPKKGRVERAYVRRNRNPHWQRIVAKCGGRYDVQIVGRFDTEEDAFEVERALIRHYGRCNDGGTLCNLTLGGEGHSGLSPAPSTRAKLREAFSGPGHPNWGKRLSPETCRRKSESMKASPKSLRGRTLPQWWRDRIAAAKIGPQNPMWGKPSPQRRPITDEATGTVYPSVTAAAEACGLRMQTLHNMLTGFRPNRTRMRFA